MTNKIRLLLILSALASSAVASAHDFYLRFRASGATGVYTFKIYNQNGYVATMTDTNEKLNEAASVTWATNTPGSYWAVVIPPAGSPKYTETKTARRWYTVDFAVVKFNM